MLQNSQFIGSSFYCTYSYLRNYIGVSHQKSLDLLVLQFLIIPFNFPIYKDKKINS